MTRILRDTALIVAIITVCGVFFAPVLLAFVNDWLASRKAKKCCECGKAV
jgi:hypothetical protein